MWGSRIGSVPGLNLAWRSLATSSFTQSSPHWRAPTASQQMHPPGCSPPQLPCQLNAAIWAAWNNSTWSWIHMEKESPLLRAPKKKASQTLLLLPVNSWSQCGLGSHSEKQGSHWHSENERLACLLILRPWPLSLFLSVHIKYFRVIFPWYK